ncbi:MAG TPA: DNA polymerase III subunit beta [Verrucomicrobiae bacterium]|jgi:DNA polymerase-3 subunit beta|nr:DNA polymerase III subunit beta [Verrucomicrobiae bacterium]
MKLTISKEQMIQGLQAVQNIISTRTTLPVLSNVLLRAEGNRLDLTATDLDVSISSAVEASVQEPGAVTLPAKKLFGIVKELPTPQIDIEIDDKNVCRIMAGSSFYRINGLAAEEFPPFPKFAENRKITLPQDKLKSLLRKTSFAISTDESRFVLNGIFMSLKDHKVTLVATDGRRLALAEEELDVPASSQGECIVPSKAITELNRLLGTQNEVEVKFSDNQVAFTLQGDKGYSTLIISKLIDGNYPNYRQVIPSEAKERVTIVREELLQALRRAEIMTSEKSNSVKLNFGKNKVEITANTPEVGEARESIAINYKGPEMAIAFNPVYLMDPLRNLDNDEVYIELIDELSPGVVKINGPFLYVIMPMRMS